MQTPNILLIIFLLNDFYEYDDEKNVDVSVNNNSHTDECECSK